ncbi:hypothetical protein GGI25_005914 [Coemansia spiralis]|uniref:Uncharacterized protein n=2 Tax=Coemansia TaxID=4863 RepID=A0A9W8G2E2_9FUNG|nr:hypothetical protein EDC05_005837 [Coemansia umbellata]KAJ2619323.1 hypothetical protein GGI26_005931 [Coemansia sp. RSA 1358]KAJ2670229.1 hypothetical protein GGI25_005914 [Coemansia spiralis]
MGRAKIEIERRIFGQQLDHFGNEKDQTEFKQVYYVDSQYYRIGGPVLLFSVGEREARQSDIEDGWVSELARQTHGLAVLLEQRFYGNSVPGDLDNNTYNLLQFLTIDQMMADIKQFIDNAELPELQQFQEKNTHAKDNAPWVLIGGSFAGNLMAWTKQKYPDIKAFVIASSAPMIVTDGYWEFDKMVAQRLPCANQLSQAIQELDYELDSGNQTTFEAIKRRFGLEQIQNKDIFVSALSIQASSLIQAPAEQQALDRIESFCHDLTTKSLAHVTREYSIWHRILPLAECPEGGDRSWFWQQCLELGMWQTAPPKSNHVQFRHRMRSQRLTTEYFQSQCRKCLPASQNEWAETHRLQFREFAETALTSYISAATASKESSSVLFTVGELDPWRYLTIDAQYPMLSSSHLLVIPGASHAEDLLAPVSSDNDRDNNEDDERPAIRDARFRMIDAVKQWIREPQNRLRRMPSVVRRNKQKTNSGNTIYNTHRSAIVASLSPLLTLLAI